MKHFDEHTLELHILNAREVLALFPEIESHLLVCDGCRSLANEIREFHSDLAEEMERGVTMDLSKNRSLIRRRAEMEPYFDPFVMPEPYRPTTIVGRVRHLIRLHPIKTTVGSFGMAAAMFILASSLTKNNQPGTITDYNPAHHLYVDSTNFLEILNAEDETLWKMKVNDAQALHAGENDGVFSTQIVDLDGDGINEVYTTASLVDYPEVKPNRLRVFDGHRHLVMDKLFQIAVSYVGGSGGYSPYISVSAMASRKSLITGKDELLIIGNSLGRSPTVLLKLGARCDILGQYWHFGDMWKLLLMDIDGDKNQELLVGGQNDIEDTFAQPYPIVAVLDIDRIKGATRSAGSPGFPYLLSDAERYYVRFPYSDIDSALHQQGMVSSVELSSDSTFLVYVSNQYLKGERIGVSYSFDTRMQVINVKSNPLTASAHQELLANNRLKTDMDDKYFQRLARKVLYFDGTGWRSDVTGVRHSQTGMR